MAGTHRQVPVAPTNMWAMIRMAMLLVLALFVICAYTPNNLVLRVVVILLGLPLVYLADSAVKGREISAHMRSVDVRQHEAERPEVRIETEPEWPPPETATYTNLRPVERPGGHGGSGGQPGTDASSDQP